MRSWLAALAERRSQGVVLIVGLARSGFSGVKAPPGHQGLVDLLGLAELQVAHLLRDCCAFMLRLQAGDQLGLETAGLLGVQVTDLLGDIKERGDGLVVALLWTLISGAASTTDLNRELLTLGVANKLARLLLNVPGGTGGLIDGPALLGALAVAVLDEGSVAFLHSLLVSLLLKGDLTGLLEVLLTHLFLGRAELGHICIMALLHILVGTLQDGILLQGGHGLNLLNTAEARRRVGLAAREVNRTSGGSGLAALSGGGDDGGNLVGRSHGHVAVQRAGAADEGIAEAGTAHGDSEAEEDKHLQN